MHAGTSTASTSSDASCSTSNYLTPAELGKMKPDVKLVVDMQPVLNKDVHIFATAAVVRQAVGGARLPGEGAVYAAYSLAVPASNRSLLKSCAKKAMKSYIGTCRMVVCWRGKDIQCSA